MKIKIQAYVEDDNEIPVEYDIVRAIFLMDLFMAPFMFLLMRRIYLEREP